MKTKKNYFLAVLVSVLAAPVAHAQSAAMAAPMSPDKVAAASFTRAEAAMDEEMHATAERMRKQTEEMNAKIRAAKAKFNRQAKNN